MVNKVDALKTETCSSFLKDFVGFLDGSQGFEA
jgi:hypothetical protein